MSALLSIYSWICIVCCLIDISQPSSANDLRLFHHICGKLISAVTLCLTLQLTDTDSQTAIRCPCFSLHQLGERNLESVYLGNVCQIDFLAPHPVTPGLCSPGWLGRYRPHALPLTGPTLQNEAILGL